MPLPDSFFAAKEKTVTSEDFNNPDPVPVQDPMEFPIEHMDDDDRVPANSLLRRKVVIRETYFKPAEAVSQDGNTGCIIYRVHFEARRFIRVWMIFGTQEFLVSETPDGLYQIDRYIQECPGGQVTVTEWHENPVIAPDAHDIQNVPEGQDPTFGRSEELMRREENDEDGINPPPTTAPLQPGDGQNPPAPGNPPAPPQTGRFWMPPELMLRVFAAHGFNERYDEGDHHVLKEYLWKLEPPVQVRGCWVTAVYRAAERTTKWHLGSMRRDGMPVTVIMEPPIRTTRHWRIPGCDDKNPLGDRQ